MLTNIEYFLVISRRIYQRSSVTSKITLMRHFLGSPVVNTLPSNNSGDAGSIPVQRAKIPQASWPKTQNRNRSDFVKNAIKTLKMAHIKKKKT